MSLRKTLVVVQFSISIVMIIGGLIVSQQMRFLLSSQLGFDTKQLITIPDAGFLTPADRGAFKNELVKLPGVKAVTSSNGGFPNRFSTSRVNIKGSSKEQQLNFMTVSFNFLPVMNIPIKEGRGFSPSFLGDTLTNGIPGGPLEQNIGGLVLNETAVRELGLPSPAIGKQILWSTDKDTSYYLTVVGVAQDFHFASLRNQIKPFGFMVSPHADANVAVKLSGDRTQQTLADIEKIWKSFPTERSFAYTFLDERFARLYTAESLFQKVFLSLVVLGIIIACMGLLGLATFAAQRRVKEIGIRKVLGASIGNLVGILSIDFLRLVSISLLIAIPIGWYGMSKWLEDFAYRIPISWWIFPLAGLLAIVIAFFTISFQAVKAALANPVKSLRTE